MRLQSFKRCVLATLLGLLITAPAAVFMASPASAAGGQCCQVSIDNMPRQFHAGGDFTPFTLHVVNQEQEPLRYLNVSLILAARGLVGDLVHLQRQRAVGGPHNVGTFTQHGVHDGAVTANDQIDLEASALPPGGGINIEYQLSFSTKMPSAELALSVQVKPKHGNAGVSSAGPYPATIVASGQPIQTQPDPTPSPTATPDDPPSTTGLGAEPTNQSSLVGDSSSDHSGSLTWLAYTMGALLLLGGIGLVGTLRWRRGLQDVGTDRDEPEQHGWSAYQTQPSGRHAAPTAQFPVAQNHPASRRPHRAMPSHSRPDDTV